jgi:hypothetical protein
MFGEFGFPKSPKLENMGTTSHHNGDVGVAALSFAHLDLSTALHDKFAAVLFDIRQLIFNPHRCR